MLWFITFYSILIVFINEINMNCLHLRKIGKFIQLFDDKYKILVNSGCFLAKRNYSVNSPSLRIIFLDYLMPNKSNFTEASINKQIDVDHHESRINNTDNNIKLLDGLDKEFWKKKLDKETIMSLSETANHVDLKKYFKTIDKKCCQILNDLSFSEVFELLNFLMKTHDTNIVKAKFYKDAIKMLKVALKRDQLNPQETFMLLFFSSLQKKLGAQDVVYVKHCLPSFTKLSLIEKCILADALFKCSIKLHKFEERVIEETIENNAKYLVENTHLLVPLCKVVRHVGPSKNFSLDNLSNALTNSTEKFNMTFSAHVLHLYAEALIKTDSLLSKLFNDAFDYLEQNNQKARVKDIDKLLWSAAALNYQFRDQDFNQIENCIKRHYPIFRIEYVKLLNIFLSLWMLNYQQKDLIEECFKQKIFEPIVKNNREWKPRAKLQLLISCIEIEAPDIEIPLKLSEPYNLQIKVKKNYKTIFQEILKMRHEFNLVDLNIINPIKGNYIPSICMKYNNDKIAYIDILDTNNCLKNSKEPHGLMKLKLRLLSKAGYQSILLTEDFGDDSKKLNDYLQKMLI